MASLFDAMENRANFKAIAFVDHEILGGGVDTPFHLPRMQFKSTYEGLPKFKNYLLLVAFITF